MTEAKPYGRSVTASLMKKKKKPEACNHPIDRWSIGSQGRSALCDACGHILDETEIFRILKEKILALEEKIIDQGDKINSLQRELDEARYGRSYH